MYQGCARGCLFGTLREANNLLLSHALSFKTPSAESCGLQQRRSLGNMLQQLCKHLRLAGLLIAAVAGFLAALLAVHQLVLPVVGWIFPSLESTFFDLAVYGGYPQRNYVSHNLTSPDLQQVRWDDKCDNGFIFISPQGKSVEHPGPMILDARGNLVWQTDQYGQAMNLKVQEYKGEKYLTFWAGHRGSSFGYGNYYMVSITSNTPPLYKTNPPPARLFLPREIPSISRRRRPPGRSPRVHHYKRWLGAYHDL